MQARVVLSALLSAVLLHCAGDGASAGPDAVGAGDAGATPPSSSSSSGSSGAPPFSDASVPANDAGEIPEPVDDAGPEGGSSGPVMIPLGVTSAIASVMISIGGSAPIEAALDTGSIGLWVIHDQIPAAGVTVTEDAVQTTYGGQLHVEGVKATTTVTLGGITSAPLPIGYQRTNSCVEGKDCPQLTQDRFFGGFKAVLGIGLRHQQNGLANVLESITAHKRWIVSMAPLGTPSGTLVLNPGTLVQRFQNGVQLDAAPNGGFLDTQVPFCANDFCGGGLFDTGIGFGILLTPNEDDYAALGVDAFAATIPGGTDVHFTVNGATPFDVAVGSPPSAGKDLFRLQAEGMSNNLSIIAFRYLDVLYNADTGRIAFAEKE